MTLGRSGSHGPGSPWRTTVADAAGVATTAARVSVNAAAARSAASCGVHGGHKRVFTRPGARAFVRTRVRPPYEPFPVTPHQPPMPETLQQPTAPPLRRSRLPALRP